MVLRNRHKSPKTLFRSASCLGTVASSPDRPVRVSSAIGRGIDESPRADRDEKHSRRLQGDRSSNLPDRRSNLRETPLTASFVSLQPDVQTRPFDISMMLRTPSLSIQSGGFFLDRLRSNAARFDCDAPRAPVSLPELINGAARLCCVPLQST